MLLSSNSTSEKEYRRYQKAEQALQPYRAQTGVMEDLKKSDLDAYAQASYLYNAAGMSCHSHTKTTYYPIGEKFHAALLAGLLNPKKLHFNHS